MTASSYYSSSYYPHFGRLHDIRGGGWAGRTSSNPSDWLQVNFGRIALVCAVATQGDKYLNEWVIDFSLSFSSDGASWMYSNDSQGNKMASLYLLIFFCWFGLIIIKETIEKQKILQMKWLRELLWATPENTIILFVCSPTFCISIVSSFSWDLQWSQQKAKAILMQNLGGRTKSGMVFPGMADFYGENCDDPIHLLLDTLYKRK